MHIAIELANVSGYITLRFWANLEKYQTIVPAKIALLREHCSTIRV